MHKFQEILTAVTKRSFQTVFNQYSQKYGSTRNICLEMCSEIIAEMICLREKVTAVNKLIMRKSTYPTAKSIHCGRVLQSSLKL